MAQPPVTLRSVKGAPLTWQEGDENFSNLAAASLPTGGVTGQILTKTGETDYAVEFASIPSQLDDQQISSTLGWSSSKITQEIGAIQTGIASLSEDTAPALGGDLNTTGYTITADAISQVIITVQDVAFASTATVSSTEIQLTNGPNTINLYSIDGIEGELNIESTTLKFNSMQWPAADGTANQVLTTDGAGNLSWSTVSGGGGASALADLTDVTITDATANDVLLWDGTAWINSPVLGDIEAALIAING